MRRSLSTPARSRVRRPRAVAVLGAMAVLVGLVGVGASSATSAAASTLRVIQPGADVAAAMTALRSGDTLELAPGTYNTGYLRVTMAAGTASGPITVTAQDPNNPPLLVGGLELYSPTYVNLTHLRIQGTGLGLAGLNMVGGTGWMVDSSEIWGAAQTHSLANVVISGTGGFPRAFRFSQNCVHDAANDTASGQVDHNIYVNFQGNAYTSGSILRNLIYTAPNGENIKLGDGGLAGALGPWGVRVANNTLARGGRQVLLHANVRNNTVVGNLFYYATQGFVANPQTTQVYIHDVVGTNNYFSHNYSADASMMMYDPSHKATLGAGNVNGSEPAFLGAYTCTGWRQTLPASLPFGRWGTGSWAK